MGMRDSPYKLITTVGAAIEPIGISELADYLRLPDESEAGLLQSLLVAARLQLEDYAGISFLPQTFQMSMDQFPQATRYNIWASIFLPRAPLATIGSITYYDLSGTQQTLSNTVYAVDTARIPGQVSMIYGSWWPAIRFMPNSVQVNFTAGYPTVDAVPDPLLHALRLAVGSFYEYREDETEGRLASIGAIRRLVSNYRSWGTL